MRTVKLKSGQVVPLDAHGVRGPHLRVGYGSHPLDDAEVAAARKILELLARPSRTSVSSYGLKHTMEDNGRLLAKWCGWPLNGYAYVCNGAAIAAAIELGYPTTCYADSLNADVRLHCDRLEDGHVRTPEGIRLVADYLVGVLRREVVPHAEPAMLRRSSYVRSMLGRLTWDAPLDVHVSRMSDADWRRVWPLIEGAL